MVVIRPAFITARKRSLGQGNIFTPVCHSVHRGGHAWLLWGGHAWLLWGDVHGCSRGSCVVALGGHAWLLWGGMCGCSGGHVWLLWGACMVAWGRGMHGCLGGGACMVAWERGMCGCSGGDVWLLGGCMVGVCVWLLQGACMVALGVCMVALGGVHGCSWGGGHAWDTMRHGDMVNERAVRILLECILVLLYLRLSFKLPFEFFVKMYRICHFTGTFSCSSFLNGNRYQCFLSIEISIL